MNCPACPEVALRRREHDGVAIESCPHCGGVWLARGALEQIAWQARHGRSPALSWPHDAVAAPAARHRPHLEAPVHDDRPDTDRRRRRASSWRRLQQLFDGRPRAATSRPPARSA